MSKKQRGPIVLMYHGTPEKKPVSQYSIRADRFNEHLEFLKNHNWYTALANELNNERFNKLPEKTVLLTFDDGYADNFEGAFQPLLEKKMKATWFIATDCIGSHAHWMGPECSETKMLNKEQLIEMAQMGMEIGAHTCSHPDLETLPCSEQVTEMGRSKELLEQIIQKEVTSFAYPYGRYNNDSIASVKTCGYQLAFTVRPGWFNCNEDPLLIRRVTIFDSDSVGTLERKLQFADNDVSWKKITTYYAKRILSRVPFTSKSA